LQNRLFSWKRTELMTAFWLITGTAIGAYLIGAIPFGYLVGRWRGVNIFDQGSGNIGATNVGRVLGRRFGILVFFLDFAKGALPVLGALRLAVLPVWGPEPLLPPEALGAVAGLGAFLGHVFPVYLRFRGGKGVATGAGVIAVLVPGPALAAMLCWVGFVCATRYVSLASLAAVTTLAGFRLLAPAPFARGNLIVTLFCGVAAVLVFLRHRSNLARLLRGTENRLRDGPAMLTFTKTVHVLALGLWFGTVVFFTFVVGLTLFGSFEKVGADYDNRPPWFPTSPDFAKADGVLDGPKEQGTRAAGTVITPLFGWYFLIQGVCGFLAVGTALGWSNLNPQGRVQKFRIALLLAGLATVVIGWPLEQHVGELRQPRNEAVDEFLQSRNPKVEADLREKALEARAKFGLWHGISLLLNFGTLALVGAALALAAQLPAAETRPELKPSLGGNGSQKAEVSVPLASGSQVPSNVSP
jgi:acyl-phosphate glycerol 3-phosphate acyltransferase